MSNREFDPSTGKKKYIPRDERRRRRNVRRTKLGAPPEIPVDGLRKDARAAAEEAHPKGYNRVIQLVNPVTGQPITEPQPARNGDAAFLIDGVKYVWDGLGGAEGFLRWSRTHETKFRELAMKLIPAQVVAQQESLGVAIHISHALPPPNYMPHRFGPSNTVEVIQTVDAEALREALLALSPAERERLLADVDSENTDPPEA